MGTAKVQTRVRIYALHYENMPVQIYWKFYNQKKKKKKKKKWKFSDKKNSTLFYISA